MYNYIGKDENIHSAAMLWAAELTYNKNNREISDKTRISFKKLNEYREGLTPIEDRHASLLNHYFRLGYGFFEQTVTMKELTTFEKDLLLLAEKIVREWDLKQALPRRLEKLREKILYSEKRQRKNKEDI